MSYATAYKYRKVITVLTENILTKCACQQNKHSALLSLRCVARETENSPLVISEYLERTTGIISFLKIYVDLGGVFLFKCDLPTTSLR